MPGVGLGREAVIDAAQAIADAGGLDSLDLTVLAEACGVRKPSLYKHVDGLPDLLGELAARGYHGLAAALEDTDDLLALARAWRAFATRHPGLYAAAVPTQVARAGPGRVAAEEALAAVLERFAAAGCAGDDAVHAARALRSLVHGFVDLERSGGFGLAASVDESFDRAVRALLVGLAVG